MDVKPADTQPDVKPDVAQPAAADTQPDVKPDVAQPAAAADTRPDVKPDVAQPAAAIQSDVKPDVAQPAAATATATAATTAAATAAATAATAAATAVAATATQPDVANAVTSTAKAVFQAASRAVSALQPASTNNVADHSETVRSEALKSVMALTIDPDARPGAEGLPDFAPPAAVAIVGNTASLMDTVTKTQEKNLTDIASELANNALIQAKIVGSTLEKNLSTMEQTSQAKAELGNTPIMGGGGRGDVAWFTVADCSFFRLECKVSQTL